ncbi:nuclear factor 7, ovary-like [Seriola lalandi dorsalis]|uniref:nuclear factor 7, ovary-like n=1 Tax=Seriola lalandi dorsalis TaxID=1841481 RepID=UPI000C6F97E4|nr:nuclear factor 7, ovary-like [Seriola lalandi dorsalis]
MRDVEEDEDGAESPVPSCWSMKSDRSRNPPLFFRNEPEPSHTQGESYRQRAESPVPSCWSVKSDRSRNPPLFFRNEPEPSHTQGESYRQRAESPVSSCWSMKSDRSKDEPLFFSDEPGPSHSQGRKRSDVSVSSCALCQDVLKDPVSTSCGHWFCRQCITSYWDQSGSSGDFSCCAQRKEKVQRGQSSSSSCRKQKHSARGLHQINDPDEALEPKCISLIKFLYLLQLLLEL